MNPLNRVMYGVVARLPVLPRALMGMTGVMARRPERVLDRARRSVAAVEQPYLDRPEVRKVLEATLVEAFRRGGRGPAWELRLYARPWGFDPRQIQHPVHLWHGEHDSNAPVIMGRHLAASIPDCRASFYPDEGHLGFLDRMPEILRTLCP